MARRYSAIGADSAADETSLLAITSAATIRPLIYDVIIGCAGTPADQACMFWLQRYTAAGTATAVTPQPTDPASPSALASAGQAHTVEPTYTAGQVQLQIPINQQATFRWVQLPERGIMLPSTAANGAGLVWKELSGGTPTYEAQIFYEE